MTAVGQQVVAIAESWIGTPYRHQGATKGVGCDCIGLIRGVWRELYGNEPEAVPAYAPDWAERCGEERLLDAGRRLFGSPLALDEAQPGDIVMFRWRSGCAAKHAGILKDADHFIHSYEQNAVSLSPLVPSWRRRIVAVHRFRAQVPR